MAAQARLGEVVARSAHFCRKVAEESQAWPGGELAMGNCWGDMVGSSSLMVISGHGEQAATLLRCGSSQKLVISVSSRYLLYYLW